MAKVTTAGGAASNKEILAFINDDVMILNKVEAPSVVIVPSDGTPPSDMPASAPAPAPMAALLSISNGTPTTMFPPTPEPTRPPSHSYLEWARIATEAPSILTNKAGTMTSPMIASNASVLNAFNTIAPSTSVVTKNSTTTNTTTTTATAPTCASSISYLYKEAELVTHCNKNSDCAGWTEDGPGCCLYPHCICGPKNVGGSATVSCLAY